MGARCGRGFIANTWHLGLKELWSLWRDPAMLVLIAYVFSVGVYTAATAMPETLSHAPVAIVDEDRSALSQRIAAALYPPHFSPPGRSPGRTWIRKWTRACTPS